MNAVLDKLLQLLALERIEDNLFRGQSERWGSPTVFGGQALGQALSAAMYTLPASRHVHSLHAYFLRPGDVAKPIVYDVDRIRDGTSFTTRRVRAIQNGHAILALTASFQIEEPGFDHQDTMPEAPPPETCLTDIERVADELDRFPEAAHKYLTRERAFELRSTDPKDDPFRPEPHPPKRMVWLRTSGKLPDEPALHRKLAAYVSDYAFLTTALCPHGYSWMAPEMQVASIDHSMWFHRPFRIDDWLLHVMDSPSANGARGLVRGQLFTRDGKLVASTAQEGLLRRHST
ncbi:MAG: acyl-CoA thioesterase II [Clostridia bacterium]|nr:acyl-CoA thioesterase II [Deltaproteobacteria bacterium]